LCLCSCTVIELMTAVGVTAYLLYLNEFILAFIASLVFSKVIVFHFIIDYYDKRSASKITKVCVKC